MIANGFVAKYSQNGAVFTSYLLISSGEHCMKARYKTGKQYSVRANFVDKLLSILSVYIDRDWQNNPITKSLIDSIEATIEKQRRATAYENIVIIRGNFNNFSLINIDNKDEVIIRKLTKFNFVAIDMHKSVNRLYLNHLYSNLRIERHDFDSEELGDWPEAIMKKPSILDTSSRHWRDLVLILDKFYNDGYRRIRAIAATYIKSDETKELSNFYSSFYIQCSAIEGLVKKRKEIYVKYSLQNESLMDYAVGAIYAYLSNLKNFYDIYKGKRDLTHIFKIGKTISINDKFIESIYLKYVKYSLNIDMYNYYDSKSYMYNLFVVHIGSHDIIAAAIDEKDEEFDVHEIQVILTYNKAKEYQLFKNDNFHDKVHMKKIVEKIIGNSVLIMRKDTSKTALAFIIAK